MFAGMKTLMMSFVLIAGASIGGVQADDLLRQEREIRQSSRIVRMNQQVYELAYQEQWARIVKYIPQIGQELGRSIGKTAPSLLTPHTINMIGQAYGKMYFQNKKALKYAKKGQLFFVFCMSVIEQANVAKDVKKSIYAWNHYFNLLNRKILSAQFFPAISIKEEPFLKREE